MPLPGNPGRRRAKFDTKHLIQSVGLKERDHLTNVRGYLTLSKPQIKAIFKALAKETAVPVIICGNRNVGLVIRLVLMLLEVPTPAIAHVYIRSKDCADAVLEQNSACRRTMGLEE